MTKRLDSNGTQKKCNKVEYELSETMIENFEIIFFIRDFDHRILFQDQ